MRRLRVVLGDQLSAELTALRGLNPASDMVLMCEVAEEATYVRHHRQKLVFVFSAMRHFAAELRARGIKVRYVALDDPDNSGSLDGELARACADAHFDAVVATEPGEWRVRAMMDGWAKQLGLPVEIRDDARFLCSVEQFAAWAGGRKQLRMEYFYRDMRRRTGWLMDGDQPVGGAWNFDAANRRALPEAVRPAPALRFPPDTITRQVMALVARRFPDHFGDLASFGWGVSRSDARAVLAHFIVHGLPSFGDYQDAMRHGDDFLFHSALSPYLNVGLLLPEDVCRAALDAYAAGRAPLNSVEGFVRQILGWREFVRGIYWTRMPRYAQGNALAATAPLPALYWSGDTDLACLRECVRNTHDNAYAHHIQRLMVTGNFALLLGVQPAALEAWYLAVYVDAFDWVELPNTHGMVLHADGGVLGSKPYAASGAYIDRMSDYCSHCRYSPRLKSGPDACPFNYLYWDFLQRNESRLGQNPRLAMPYRNLRAMSPARRRQITEDSRRFAVGLQVEDAWWAEQARRPASGLGLPDQDNRETRR